MGQRLVMTIKENDIDLMKVYYHWSAYTVNALYEAEKFLDSYYSEELENIEDTKLRCVRALEGVYARLDNDSEFEEFKRLYPGEFLVNEGLDRSRGLIALTEKDMQEIQNWSEGDIYVDLTSKTVNNSCHAYYQSIDEYNDWNEFEEDEIVKIEDIDLYDIELSEISFEDLNSVIHEMSDLGTFKNSVNEIFQCIE